VLLLSLLAALSPAVRADTARFSTVDVYLDSADAGLAAYQIEIVASPLSVQLVGVEGGDSAAFAAPPYYDPAALAGHRIILAAFSTADELPRGVNRVARLHIRESDGQAASFAVRVEAAADRDGAPLDVAPRIVPQTGEPA